MHCYHYTNEVNIMYVLSYIALIFSTYYLLYVFVISDWDVSNSCRS